MQEMARASGVAGGCGVVIMPEYASTVRCCTACGSVDLGLPPPLPGADPLELLSGLTPHRGAKVQSKVIDCPDGHE